MKSSPAFQFYPADFLADENVALMSLAGRGAYITLICYCWREGSIPADMHRMGRLCGIDSSAMAELWTELSSCFQLANDRYLHPRLERERTKQTEHSRERQESGRRGALLRWEKSKDVQTQEDSQESAADSSAIAELSAEPIAKNASSSSSSSSDLSKSTSKSKKDRGMSRSQSSRDRRSNLCDEEFLEELQKNPAYQSLNVRLLYQRMCVWCQQKRKQPTRMRLINWLNNEDIPMGSKNGSHPSGQPPKRKVVV